MKLTAKNEKKVVFRNNRQICSRRNNTIVFCIHKNVILCLTKYHLPEFVQFRIRRLRQKQSHNTKQSKFSDADIVHLHC